MPICVTERKIELGVEVSLFCGLPIPPSGQTEIVPDTDAVRVERPQRIHCIKISPVGGLLT